MFALIKKDPIRADLFRYKGRCDFKAFRSAMRDPGFKFSFYFRLCAAYHKYSFWGVVGRVMYKHYFYKFGYQIPRATKIGKGLRISHFGSLVINVDSTIGENCYLSHNITLGKTSRGKNIGCPRIGDKVWIGPGAVIVGNISVGNNVLIAGNAFVNFDVPPNSIVFGNPATIKNDVKATEGYITNIV